MKNLLRAAIVVAFVGLASPVMASNPTGTWKWTTSSSDQTLESAVRLRFDSEGPVLTGVYVDGQSNRDTPISAASFKAGKISFSVIRESNGQQFTIKCSGTLSGDTITGKLQFEGGGQIQSTNWVATRQK